MALSATFAGCHIESPGQEEDNTVSPGELIERKDIPLTRSQKDFVKANNAFALGLFGEVAGADPGKSIVISPLSVTFALGMVDNGARGDTRREINEALGYEGDSMDDLNSFCRTMLEQGAGVDPSTTVEIANMALVNKECVSLKDAFASKIESDYRADICYKDFSKEDVRSFVNKWCEEKTHGMIKDFLKDPPSPVDYAHFLNATYFKGIWSSQFKKGDTREEPFTDAEVKQLRVKMMHQKAKFNYTRVNGLCSAVCLPYGNQAFRMVIILPEEGGSLDGMRKGLTPEVWERLNSMEGVEVDVKIPSFETEYGTESLKAALRDMGIKTAFDSARADFSDMTDETVFIADVLHKARIKVDEQGSEAAAVTDVVIRKNSASEPQGPVDFHADRPFIYAITEVSTGAIFFIGQYAGK